MIAALEGFTPAERDGLVLVNDHVARADFVLRPGGVEEQVQVTADTLLESHKADVGSVVTERAVHELPLNVRDPLSLVTLTPGVTTGGNVGSGGGRSAGRNVFKANFRVAGGRHRGQDVLLDGVANVTVDAFVGYIPPVDATQEFKVETNAFSAEYGRTTGGILSVVTKSGTNELRGTAYEFYRNDGYGIFYAPMPVRRIGSIGFDTETPWVASLDGLVPTNYLRDPFPHGFNVPTGERDPLTNVGFDLSSTTRDEAVGYTQQWSLSIQRQLGDCLLVDVSYLRVNRPSVRDDRSARLDDPTIDRWFDTEVFRPADAFTFGDVSRTLPDVRADGVKNVDLTLSKSLRVGRYRLQVRADVFNIFNRTQFAAPNGSVTSAAFGTVTSQANSPREIQLGVKLYF